MKFMLTLALNFFLLMPLSLADAGRCREIFILRPPFSSAVDLQRIANQDLVLNSLKTNTNDIYKTLQILLEKDPHDIDFNYAMARLFFKNKSYDIALEYISNALELSRNDPIVLDLKVDVLLALGKYEKASYLISRLLYEMPEAYLSWRQEKYREDSQIYMVNALEVGHQRIRLDPQNVEGWLLAAVGAYSLRDWQRAETLNNIVLKLDPQNPSALAMQFELDILTGQSPWTKAGWVARLNRLKKAKYVRPGLVIATYDKILEFDPTSRTYQTGKALFLYQNAMSYIATHSRNLSGNREVLVRLERALAAIHKALTLRPGNATLERARATLQPLWESNLGKSSEKRQSIENL
jgi:tetratricopeptide (TPR) repeat protein